MRTFNIPLLFHFFLSKNQYHLFSEYPHRIPPYSGFCGLIHSSIFYLVSLICAIPINLQLDPEALLIQTKVFFSSFWCGAYVGRRSMNVTWVDAACVLLLHIKKQKMSDYHNFKGSKTGQVSGLGNVIPVPLL